MRSATMTPTHDVHFLFMLSNENKAEVEEYQRKDVLAIPEMRFLLLKCRSRLKPDCARLCFANCGLSRAMWLIYNFG